MKKKTLTKTKKSPTKVKKPLKTVKTKKPTAKSTLKPTPKKKVTSKPKTPSKKTMGGARVSKLAKVLQETHDEIEQYFLDSFKKDEEFNLTPTKIAFCLALMDNGWNKSKAYLKAVPDSADLSQNAHCVRALKWLEDKNIQCFIAREMAHRRTVACATHAWVVQRYYDWSTIDPTEFFDLGKNGKRNIIILKKKLSQLPKEIRTAISEISVDPKTNSIKVKFVNQKDALDRLSKLLGYEKESNLFEDASVHLHFDEQDKDA